jgi:hypothetical protein
MFIYLGYSADLHRAKRKHGNEAHEDEREKEGRQTKWRGETRPVEKVV